ncbi:MAG: hypothetical protein JO081_15835 [Alphaproteobacteria bacterium]|nr:hypothetical protein [Alphaproteobacteria bacterium]
MGHLTNTQRAFNQPNQQLYCKDGIIQAVVHGNKTAINPELHGTKASAHYRLTVAAKGSQTLRLRPTDQPPDRLRAPFEDAFEAPLKVRQRSRLAPRVPVLFFPLRRRRRDRGGDRRAARPHVLLNPILAGDAKRPP